MSPREKDFLAGIKSPDYHFPDRSGPMELGTPFRKIVIVQLFPARIDKRESEDQYEEISRLVETLGGKVVGRVVQRRSHPHKRFFVGPGKADQVGSLCDAKEADTVVIDSELTPEQVASLEYETGSHVMDRTELILEIFARRAKTAEAKMQVELAYLDYVHPKMDRQSAVRAYRGGLRGHGESALGKRIRAGKSRAVQLRKKIDKLEKQREQRLQNRSDAWTAALIGYTNAGKSTLLNALAGESVYADDRLFATLDTTTRRVFLGDNSFALISDTVGFIRRLPHQLIASFHSTLAEALSAKLLLHVADASSPTLEAQLEAVESTLEEIDTSERPILLVFNKCDQADPMVLAELAETYRNAEFVSAKTGRGLPELKESIRSIFLHGTTRRLLEVSAGAT